MGRVNEIHRHEWIVAVWAGGLVCGVLVLITWPISPWSKWDWTGQTAAAWIQAIGSIVAILTTAGVMLWQHSLQLSTTAKSAIREELEWIGAMASMFELAAARTRDAIRGLENPSSWEDFEVVFYPFEDYDSLAEALKLTSADQTRNPTLILALLSGRVAYEEVVRRLDRYIEEGLPPQHMRRAAGVLSDYLGRIESSRLDFVNRKSELLSRNR